MIIGTAKIEKHFDKYGNFYYISFIDLEEPECEYREHSDGSKFWFKNGLYHRDCDEPAIISSDGSKFWLKNDKLHRDGDEPAIIYSDGAKFWYKDGIQYKNA